MSDRHLESYYQLENMVVDLRKENAKLKEYISTITKTHVYDTNMVLMAENQRLKEAFLSIAVWTEGDYKKEIDVYERIVTAVNNIAEQALAAQPQGGDSDGTRI